MRGSLPSTVDARVCKAFICSPCSCPYALQLVGPVGQNPVCASLWASAAPHITCVQHPASNTSYRAVHLHRQVELLAFDIWRVVSGPAYVCEVADRYDLCLVAYSEHLDILRWMHLPQEENIPAHS